AIPAKKKTQEKRRESKKKDYNRMKDLENKLASVTLSQRKDEDITELIKLKSNQVYVNRDRIEVLKGILRDLGFPVISARGEGEKTCCMLAIEGEVAAVYSPDTDCIAIGAPLVIQDLWTKAGTAKCVVFATV